MRNLLAISVVAWVSLSALPAAAADPPDAGPHPHPASARLAVFPLQPGDELPQQKLTLELKSVTAQDVSELLSGITGQGVVFLPRRPGELLSLDVKELPVAEVLQLLAAQGVVLVGGRKVSEGPPPAADPEALYSIQARAVDGRAVTELLSHLLGPGAMFEPSSGASFDLDIEALSAGEILEYLGGFGEVRLSASAAAEIRAERSPH